MQLHYVSRSDYRLKTTAEFQDQLKQQFGEYYLIPEGGTNDLAIKGCRELLSEMEDQLGYPPNYYSLCVGTGGTIAGIVEAAQPQQEVLGFAALKGDFLQKEVESLVKPAGQLNIISDYHFGGYAKHKPELIEFINHFKKETGIPLDPIYTGKMFYGLADLLQKAYFKKGTTLIAIHSGGLQGIAGFNDRHGDLIT
jgi:1-aminocyclopropane-1-carboxylate deaminase